MTGSPADRLSAALEGRYRIERELGAGGMATVYLADDLKHHRKVAVKVLKPELAAVVGKERFFTEIETTAQLQHPNILPLFDSGEADGLLFYCMPYVEGETLGDRLGREKQLPVEVALDLTRKLAAALDYAHQRGVVHRDIKPANILLSSGEPLIADFGIALAVSQAGDGRITETGLSVGTPHYMSPEQASGDRSLDPRSDVYALGCVLYEMLAGEPPFPGPSAQAVLARVLTEDAPPLRARRRAVPQNVDAATRKALEKLPADRFATAGELARALVDPAFRWGTSADTGMGTGPGRGWKAGALLLSVATVISGAGWALSLAREDGPGVSMQRISLWRELEGDFVRSGLAVSPDGATLVFADHDVPTLMVKPRGELLASPLDGAEIAAESEGWSAPTFSPDGAYVAYFGSSALQTIPVGGGVPRVVADSVATTFREVAWLDDGSLVYNGVGWRLMRVSEHGGEAEVLHDPAEFVIGVTPLPEARGVLFNVCDNQCPNPALWVFDLESREARELIPDAVRGYYSSDTGHLLYVMRDGRLHAVPFDLASLEIEGPPIPLMSGIRVRRQYADLKLAAGGTLVYLLGEALEVQGTYHLGWADRTGAFEMVDGQGLGNVAKAALSPDGARVALDEDGEVWALELASGARTRLTGVPVGDRRPSWSPDGTQVLFFDSVGVAGGERALFRRRADGSEPARRNADGLPVGVEEWTTSADGSVAMARVGDRNAEGPATSLWLVEHPSDSVPREFLAGEGTVWAPTLSPDGRWVAYVSDESGTPEVYVRPVPDGSAARYTVTAGGALEPLWSPAGDEIFYRTGPSNRVFRSARVRTSPSFEVVARDSLFAMGSLRTGNWHRAYDVTRDGERFLLIRSQTVLFRTMEENVPELVLVEGWTEELRRRLAPGGGS